MKHTPGPWRVQLGDDPGELDVTTDEDEPWFICTCHDGIENNPEKANAKLIAAAPELLEALKKVLPWIGALDLQEEAIAAIAKAES